MRIKPKEIGVGLVGLGTVGSGVTEILIRHQKLLTERVGIPIVLKKAAEKNKDRIRCFKFHRHLIFSPWEELVTDPSISVIVELIGGTSEAKKLILSALNHGKHVVTANKALLATQGREIFETAHRNKLDLCFEAAVGGGIPILRALREGFVANEIESIWGIINGTCNYILSEMSEEGKEFGEVLKQAQELGYAEQDPSLDIDGIDAAHKLSILTSIAYGVYLPFNDIYVEGIRHLTSFDIECAKRFGFVIKLLGIAKKSKKGAIEARVHPCMIPSHNPLANVREAFNAILLDGDYVGPSLLYGKGAGSHPTASAVVGDIVEVARNVMNGVNYTVPPLGHYGKIRAGRIDKIGDLESEYYLRFSVIDKPGVLAKISGILGEQGISISSVYQQGQDQGRQVPIIILTHKAREANLLKAISKINRLKVVKKKTVFIRIESDR